MTEGIIGGIIVGIIAGFLAGKIMRGEGFGCLWNCILGVIGGVVGGWLFNILNISWGGTVGVVGTAVVGAVVVLWIASFFKK
ncbi:MAG: GlsB/YeaQ/YmgE family stress response membrane protein [Prevotella sp.]|nr:GlsB/YeaQ/YmgE family stress response membrane protein [Prevotella sp.]